MFWAAAMTQVQAQQIIGPQPAAQDTTREQVMVMVEQLPEYPGGTQAFYRALAKNLRLTPEVVKSGAQGKVVVSFLVQKNGKVEDITVLQSLHPAVDREVVRSVRKLKRFKPATQNGKAVWFRYTVPISISLSN